MAGAVIWEDLKVTSKQAFLITYHHHVTNYTIIIYPFEEDKRHYLEECKLYIFLSKSNFLIFFALKGDCLKAYVEILISVNRHKQYFFMVYNVMKMNQL
jgi:hypothetical protein